MLARDAIAYLVAELGLIALGSAGEGENEYIFDNPFPFVVTEIDDITLAIFAPLPVPDAVPAARLMQRLLEANLQGAESGMGALCMNHRGEIGYRDVLDLTEMTLAQVQLRFVDFSLYFEFWRSEGMRFVEEELGGSGLPGEGFIRL